MGEKQLKYDEWSYLQRLTQEETVFLCRSRLFTIYWPCHQVDPMLVLVCYN